MGRRHRHSDGSATATLTACQALGQLLYAAYAVEGARRLGVDRFGLVTAGVGLTLVTTDLVDFGRTTVMLRAVAGGADAGHHVGSQLSWRLRSLSAVGAASLALLALVAPGHVALLSGLCLYLVLAGTAATLNAALRAAGRFGQAGLQVLAERCAALGLGSVLLAVPATRTPAYGLGLAAGSALSCAYALRRLPRSWWALRRAPLRAQPHRYADARHFGVTSVLTDLWMADATVVTGVAGALQGGLFAAATRFAGPMAMLPKNLAAVLLVRASSAGAQVVPRQSHRRLVGRLVLLVSVLLAPVFVLAPSLLGLLFGAAYRPAAGVLRLYCLASVVVCATEPAMAVLQGCGRARTVSRAVTAAVAANLACIVVGSRLDGATGAAAGYLTAQLVLLLGLSRPLRALGAAAGREEGRPEPADAQPHRVLGVPS